MGSSCSSPLIQSLAFPVPPDVEPPTKRMVFEHWVSLGGDGNKNKNQNKQIPLYFLPSSPSSSPSTSTTILVVSHGNATDLEREVPLLQQLNRKLDVSVVGYDYFGYGQSKKDGKPSAEDCIRSLEAVMNWIRSSTFLGSRQRRILLLGISIGTGPTVQLASNLTADECSGMVLMSPFRSVLQAATNNPLLDFALQSFDFFTTDAYLGRVHENIPVLIIHGSEDTVIPLDHSLDLMDILDEERPIGATNATLKIIKGAGHNDLFNFEATWKSLALML